MTQHHQNGDAPMNIRDSTNHCTLQASSSSSCCSPPPPPLSPLTCPFAVAQTKELHNLRQWNEELFRELEDSREIIERQRKDLEALASLPSQVPSPPPLQDGGSGPMDPQEEFSLERTRRKLLTFVDDVVDNISSKRGSHHEQQQQQQHLAVVVAAYTAVSGCTQCESRKSAAKALSFAQYMAASAKQEAAELKKLVTEGQQQEAQLRVLLQETAATLDNMRKQIESLLVVESTEGIRAPTCDDTSASSHASASTAAASASSPPQTIQQKVDRLFDDMFDDIGATTNMPPPPPASSTSAVPVRNAMPIKQEGTADIRLKQVTTQALKQSLPDCLVVLDRLSVSLHEWWRASAQFALFDPSSSLNKQQKERLEQLEVELTESRRTCNEQKEIQAALRSNFETAKRFVETQSQELRVAQDELKSMETLKRERDGALQARLETERLLRASQQEVDTLQRHVAEARDKRNALTIELEQERTLRLEHDATVKALQRALNTLELEVGNPAPKSRGGAAATVLPHLNEEEEQKLVELRAVAARYRDAALVAQRRTEGVQQRSVHVLRSLEERFRLQIERMWEEKLEQLQRQRSSLAVVDDVGVTHSPTELCSLRSVQDAGVQTEQRSYIPTMCVLPDEEKEAGATDEHERVPAMATAASPAAQEEEDVTLHGYLVSGGDAGGTPTTVDFSGRRVVGGGRAVNELINHATEVASSPPPPLVTSTAPMMRATSTVLHDDATIETDNDDAAADTAASQLSAAAATVRRYQRLVADMKEAVQESQSSLLSAKTQFLEREALLRETLGAAERARDDAIRRVRLAEAELVKQRVSNTPAAAAPGSSQQPQQSSSSAALPQQSNGGRRAALGSFFSFRSSTTKGASASSHSLGEQQLQNLRLLVNEQVEEKLRLEERVQHLEAELRLLRASL